MPVTSCTRDGKPGFKWGRSGRCYVYTANNAQSRHRAIEQAQKQGRAIKAQQGSTK